MLHIVTDGAADIPVSWEKDHAIHIIPINVQFGEKTYLQFVDLDLEAFYQMVADTKTIPKTSQPSPHQFSEFYRRIASPGDSILSLHVTSRLSGTFASAVAAARELAGTCNILPFDSASGSLGLGFMCRTASQLNRAGRPVEEIVRHLEALRDRVEILLTLDTLEYARMSGRVGTLSAALASVLNVKPIAVLKDGMVNMVSKVRTRRASLERLVEMAHETCGSRPVHLGVMHARDPRAGRQLLDHACRRLNVVESVLVDLTISLAVNFGPGAVGLTLYPAD